ncbi:MAG: hypothetical protein WD009_08880 [Phycisphaeraceae bacterium]
MINPDQAEPITVLDGLDLATLLEPADWPCICIYMPTHRLPTEAEHNRIWYKNQLQHIEQTLDEEPRPTPPDRQALLEPLRQLVDDRDFWDAQREGLVVFRSRELFWMRRLPRPVPAVTVVASSWHVKPLIRQLQETSRYQVLCVSMERVALYRGDRHALKEVALHPSVPANMAAAIGEPSHVTKTRRTRYDQGETDPRDEQLKRYFRRLDEAVTRHHCRDNLPTILAAQRQYHGFFHEASHNPDLLDTGVQHDPFAHEIDAPRLRELAWAVIEPYHQRHVAELRDRFEQARAHEQGLADLEPIARVAVRGRVDTLMVREDHRLGGTLDHESGEIELQPLDDPEIDDVIDDLAETVLRRKGKVRILPRDAMPEGAPELAAILRY